MSLAALLKTIRAQAFTDAGGRPIVTLEEFFVENEDLGSIGCNLDPHPGTDAFFSVLRALRERSDVQDVLVGVAEDMGDDQWPFSDCVYVITTASPEELASWVEELGPDPIEAEGYYPAPPTSAPTLKPGYRVFTVWWD